MVENSMEICFTYITIYAKDPSAKKEQVNHEYIF